MSGPVLVIELMEAVPTKAIQRLREFLCDSSARFEEKRVGEYDLNVHAESLGILDTGGVDGRRPILVSLLGPGISGDAIFEAEHADEVDQKPLIGFTPTHCVDVIALCDSPVDDRSLARSVRLRGVPQGVGPTAQLPTPEVEATASVPTKVGCRMALNQDREHVQEVCVKHPSEHDQVPLGLQVPSAACRREGPDLRSAP